MLARGEGFAAVAQQPADPVERIISVPAAVQGGLLFPAANLIHHLGAQLHDVKRVEHGDRVGQLVADRVGVAAERVQGGVLDPRDERGGLGPQPAGVGGAGPAGHDVEQAGVQFPLLIAGQVDHRRDGPVRRPGRRPPDVLVHTDRPDARQPPRAGDPGGGLGLHRPPQRVPVDPQMPGQRGHRRVVMSQGVGGPADSPRGQNRPRADQLVGLRPGPRRARRLRASPDPLQPHHQHGRPEARGVRRGHPAPAVRGGHDPAPTAAGPVRVGLHRDHQPAPLTAHVQDMHPGRVEHRIRPGTPARARTTPIVIHVGVFLDRSAWSLPILKTPTPPPVNATPARSPTLRSEEPEIPVHGDGTSLWTITHPEDFAVGLMGLLATRARSRRPAGHPKSQSWTGAARGAAARSS